MLTENSLSQSGSSSEMDKRIESEREFHNKRFAHEVRQATHGFYRTVADAFAFYESEKIRLAKNRRVLEYGCGNGQNSIKIAPHCLSIHGLDLSDVAIEQARQQSLKMKYDHAQFTAGNAEQMSFADEEFDFIYGSSILHHLDLKKAYAELVRVLKPGGIALFLEPLGHNPLINGYRNRTPDFRTPDEHPLVRSDYQLAKKFFDRVDTQFFGFCTLFTIPFLKTPMANSLLAAGSWVDRAVLRLPGVRWLSWFSVIHLRKA